MPLPIAGEVEVVVEAANPLSIHGDLYVDLAVRVPGDSNATMVRVPAHVFAAGDDGSRRVPEVGARLILRVLLGQVDSVRIPDGD